MRVVVKLFIPIHLLFLILFIGCEEAVSEVDEIFLKAPSNLSIEIINADSISMSWSDNSEGEAGFWIERMDTSGYSVIAQVSSDVTAFIDISAVYSQYNHYRVQAYHADSLSQAVEDSVAFVFLDVEWALVPAGTYRYGVSGEIRHDLDYDFEMMIYEVSNGQFVQFLNEGLMLGTVLMTGHLPLAYYDGDDRWNANYRSIAAIDDHESHINWDGDKFSADPGSENLAVSEVPWYGAYSFAKHYGLAIPTEYEWEKAARSDQADPYPWGADSLSCELANVAGCGAYIIDIGSTSGVSPFGAYDLIGNVWEWVDSFWSDEIPNRVLRGGACRSTTVTTQVYNRRSDDPWHTSYYYGFRCIRR